jgi:thiol-disulfide isomerase/thioredoxin
MKNYSSKSKMIFGFSIVILIFAFSFLIFGVEQKGVDGVLDEFAQCLANKGATMYGAEWCAHCQAEKARFGPSFKYVPYVECPDNPELCIEKNITGYPTWIFSGGTRYEGKQGLPRLSQISGCPLPQ